MLKDLQQNWDELGRRDPLWAVLTDPAKRGNRWIPEEFFDTGRREVAEVLASIQSLGLAIPKLRALDFGCGVGRLTQALAPHFESVTGIDIAASMLELARGYNRFGSRCTYILNESSDLRVLSDDVFDFVYSNYTLQHMKPGYAKCYLREFVRVLRPGGITVFQMPCATVVTPRERVRAALPPRVLRLYRRARHGAGASGPVMENYVLPREVVEQVLTDSGAQVVHVRHNPRHDRRWVSLIYYAMKPAHP